MGIRLRAASVIGPAHAKAGLPNQDAVLIRQGRWGWLAVVSDGMGSRSRADIGARTLCRSAWQSVRQLPFDCSNEVWVDTLYRRWLARLDELQIAPNDAITTCLLAWGLPDGRFRLAQLGDGLILGDPTPSKGLTSRNISSFSNLTLGLGLSKSIEDWQFNEGRLIKPGDGLILMTDGIADDLGNTDGLVQTLIMDMRHRGARAARAMLVRDLSNWPTARHSDDKTIALIFRI